jgi:anthranilate synthase component 2
MNSRVLLIDNHDSFTFNLVQLLNETGMCEVKVVKNDTLHSDLALQYEKILISPGPGIPSEAGQLMEFLRCLKPTSSLLGICLGHQAIAECFGGSLIRTPQIAHGALKEITIDQPADPLFQGIPARFNAGLYHSWAVDPVSFPPGLRISARSNDGVIMAFTHTSRNIRGVQFHPESIMTPCGPLLIKNWLSL